MAAEQVVKDIRRGVRRHFAAGDVPEGLLVCRDAVIACGPKTGPGRYQRGMVRFLHVYQDLVTGGSELIVVDAPEDCGNRCAVRMNGAG